MICHTIYRIEHFHRKFIAESDIPYFFDLCTCYARPPNADYSCIVLRQPRMQSWRAHLSITHRIKRETVQLAGQVKRIWPLINLQPLHEQDYINGFETIWPGRGWIVAQLLTSREVFWHRSALTLNRPLR